MKITKTWITGCPSGVYLSSVAMEIESNGHRFQVRGMRLVKLNGKISLAMPNKKNRVGEWIDILSPLTQETRDVLEEAALAAWSRSEFKDLLDPI